MVRTLHIVASCAKRKRAKVPAGLHLREVADAEPEHRARAWWTRLEASDADRNEAWQLYAGAHWSAVCQLREAMRPTVRPRGWVASAGYGLVSWHALLSPYSATFTPGQDDSVVRSVPMGSKRASLYRRWWHTLSTLQGPEPNEPRSLEALASTDPSAGFLIVASPAYVGAMEDDLLAARKLLQHPERLVIVSNRARLMAGRLKDHLVPVDVRARAIARGPLVALNAGVALALSSRIGAGSFDVATFRSIYEALVPGGARSF